MICHDLPGDALSISALQLPHRDHSTKHQLRLSTLLDVGHQQPFDRSYERQLEARRLPVS